MKNITFEEFNNLEFKLSNQNEVYNDLIFLEIDSKKIEEIKKEIEDLDQEKVKKIAKEKADQLKVKTTELVELAKEKGTPVLEGVANDVRMKAIEVTKEVLKKLENDEKK